MVIVLPQIGLLRRLSVNATRPRQTVFLLVGVRGGAAGNSCQLLLCWSEQNYSLVAVEELVGRGDDHVGVAVRPAASTETGVVPGHCTSCSCQRKSRRNILEIHVLCPPVFQVATVLLRNP